MSYEPLAKRTVFSGEFDMPDASVLSVEELITARTYNGSAEYHKTQDGTIRWVVPGVAGTEVSLEVVQQNGFPIEVALTRIALVGGKELEIDALFDLSEPGVVRLMSEWFGSEVLDLSSADQINSAKDVVTGAIKSVFNS